VGFSTKFSRLLLQLLPEEEGRKKRAKRTTRLLQDGITERDASSWMGELNLENVLPSCAVITSGIALYALYKAQLRIKKTELCAEPQIRSAGGFRDAKGRRQRQSPSEIPFGTKEDVESLLEDNIARINNIRWISSRIARNGLAREGRERALACDDDAKRAEALPFKIRSIGLVANKKRGPAFETAKVRDEKATPSAGSRRSSRDGSQIAGDPPALSAKQHVESLAPEDNMARINNIRWISSRIARNGLERRKEGDARRLL